MFILDGEVMKKSSESSGIEKYNKLADFFKMFGDPTRLKILILLRNGELRVTDISVKIKMNQSTVSHQLRTLKQSGLVKVKRDGKNSFYFLADDHIHQILKTGTDHITGVAE